MGAALLDAPTLAALMCSRLCHDLVAPVSAVKNALEVYNDPSMPDSREQALKVIDQAAASAAAKLEFLRIAFGAAGLGDHSADPDEAGRVAERFFSAMKPELQWRGSSLQPPLTFVRLMYNLALIALDALPRGGVVHGHGHGNLPQAQGPAQFLSSGIQSPTHPPPAQTWRHIQTKQHANVGR